MLIFLIYLVLCSQTISQINLLLLITLVSLFLIAIADKTINLEAKKRAIKVINEIIRAKLQASSIENLTELICEKLHNDLTGKFALILNMKDQLSVYGAKEFEHHHNNKISIVLKTNQPLSFISFTKISYFYPLHILGKCGGILVIEIGIWDNFILGFSKMIPLINDQISFILENFKTLTLLNEVVINEEREKLRSLILCSISHDLKTPLSSIIGGLSVYSKLNNEDQLTLVQTALEEAIRLNLFISDVLEMTRIKSGALVIQKQFINPRIIIDQILQRFEATIKDYRLMLLISEKIKINFDPLSFEQVIQNLVDNIIKYSPKNSQILIYEEIISNQEYRISFQNEGVGVSPEKLELIFDKFERLTSEGSTVYGNGLGLSIVRALMEINNATISAENVKERPGMIFILSFNDFQDSLTKEIYEREQPIYQNQITFN